VSHSTNTAELKGVRQESGTTSNYTGIPGSRLIFGSAIFISAFLLFQVQLILGKFLLPWFGGISAVWATCLVFFQVFLFLGYLYSHKVCGSLTLRKQANIHFVLLGVTMAAVAIAWSSWGSPFLPTSAWKPAPGSAPIPSILKLLTATIGLPFLLLSATGPLLQKWYGEIAGRNGDQSPYFLYALSNAGSLLGLLTYPIWFEPKLGTEWQSKLWGAGFALFVFVCGTCAWLIFQRAAYAAGGNGPRSSAAGNYPAPAQWCLWFILSALGSVMLLATTNWLTQDVAPVPLLWVLPLSIYLLTFILTFKTRPWYFRGVFHPLFALVALVTIIALFRGTDMNVLKQAGIFLAMLFTACMICHGELARLKPEIGQLTFFYLTVSAGGAFGGMFVGLIAPLVFPATWEYHLGLWLVAVVAVAVLIVDKQSWLHERERDPWIPGAFFATLFLVPKYLVHIRIIHPQRPLAIAINGLVVVALLVLVSMPFISRTTRRWKFDWYGITLVSAIIILGCGLYLQLASQKGRLLYRARNFYGALTVSRTWDNDMLHSKVSLLHGRIVHGVQVEQDRKLATTYYGDKSGAGLAITTHPRRASGNMRVGVIGLGAGTLATYARSGDTYRFYEINPMVIQLAKGEHGYFSFLKDSAGTIEIANGDARLSLEAEAERGEYQKFDVLIIDAFNGDSIPIHLLTREAMKLYLAHLRGPDSVIAMHISNIAVDLAPPIAGLAKLYGMKSTMISTFTDTGVIVPSEWILLTRGAILEAPSIRLEGKPLLAFNDTGTDVWTDNYSNLMSLFSYRAFLIKSLIRP
jgi:hypothetical protein